MTRCDACGRFIAEKDFDKGAERKLIKDNKDSSHKEEWEILCIKCNKD